MRLARLLALLGAGGLVHGGCSVDDRVLSDVDLRGGAGSGGARMGECAGSAANDCEACLYASCCEQVEACGAGSACSSYLRCASNCAGDTLCEDRCTADSPTGFGDALALGVCSQSRCSACSGQAAEFDGCDPNGGGACQSVADCAALDAGALEDVDPSACSECDANLLAPGCAECVSAQTTLSQPCSACVTEWLECAVLYCLSPCDGGGDPTACQDCLAMEGCNAQLGSCGFAE